MLTDDCLRFDLELAIMDAPLISAPFFLVFVGIRWPNADKQAGNTVPNRALASFR
jgi:hypothetical protein